MTDLSLVFDRYKTAVFEKDVEKFLSLFDADVYIFDMWGPWSLRGIEAWRDATSQWFTSLGDERVIVTFEDQEVALSTDLASATATVTYEAVSAAGEKLRSLQNRLTWVAKKKAGEWKVIHEHTSAPIHHETLKATLKRSPNPSE